MFEHAVPGAVLRRIDDEPHPDVIADTEFDLDQARRDASTIAELEPGTLAFTYFGLWAFDAELLQEYKRTLIEWVEAVRRERAELADDDAVIELFVPTLTRWRAVRCWAGRSPRRRHG